MKKTCISKGWQYYAPDHVGWADVDLPNDYVITQPRSKYAPGGASTGFFMGGTGVYVKELPLGDAKHYLLNLDGAYMCTVVNFNGRELDLHPHGYTPFLVDLSERAKRGEVNELIISTNSLQTSTRWYCGGGIYRDVYLWEGGEIRLEPWDTFVTTPTLDRVNVAYTVSADREAEVLVRSCILDADGKEVARLETPLSVKEGKNPCKISFSLPDANVWDMEHPYLYTLRTTILEGEAECDTDCTRFGIRTISVDAENGLRLNGKTIKLRGGCIHHDHGVLGVADFPAACKRKLTLLQKAGFNALRIAHNPPSELLMDLCDEMGIILMDEAFDCWELRKGGILNYHVWFQKYWESDITNMVLRDRRHPSIICYSTGNEIWESNGGKEGEYLSARLTAKIRALDPTRLVTACTFRMAPGETWGDRTAAYFAPYDLCGYNYASYEFEKHHAQFPNRVFWSSETVPLSFYESWGRVLKNSYVIGDFTWVAYDNIGEAGTGNALWARDGKITGIRLFEYPWRTCYQGDLDLCGYRRPQSYFREAVWIGNNQPRIFTTHPEHYGEEYTGTGWHWHDVLDRWNFDDAYLGKPVICEVYTDAEEVEWSVNGRVLGRSVPKGAIATYDIPYERGEIVAVTYKNGQECGRASLHTVGEPAKVALFPETDSLLADNRDLCYIDIALTDKNGDRISDSKAPLHCEVEGAQLMGIFSGDPKNEDAYGSPDCHAFEGRALAILRATKAGTVRVTVSSPDLEPMTVTVTAK